jgi:hypothetical protein
MAFEVPLTTHPGEDHQVRLEGLGGPFGVIRLERMLQNKREAV